MSHTQKRALADPKMLLELGRQAFTDDAARLILADAFEEEKNDPKSAALLRRRKSGRHHGHEYAQFFLYLIVPVRRRARRGFEGTGVPFALVPEPTREDLPGVGSLDKLEPARVEVRSFVARRIYQESYASMFGWVLVRLGGNKGRHIPDAVKRAALAHWVNPFGDSGETVFRRLKWIALDDDGSMHEVPSLLDARLGRDLGLGTMQVERTVATDRAVGVRYTMENPFAPIERFRRASRG